MSKLLPTPTPVNAASRRGFLASIAGMAGAAAVPASPAEHASALVGLLDLPPAVHEVPVTAVMWSNSAVGPERDPIAHFPSPAEARQSCLMQFPPVGSCEYTLAETTLQFPAGGRCYLAVDGEIDLPGDAVFRPRHLFDWPKMAHQVYGEKVIQWEGLSLGYIELVPGCLLTREEAMAKVADANRLAASELVDGDEWWVVVQLGKQLESPRLDFEMAGGVGTAEPWSMKFAARIVTATAAEVRELQATKGGDA